MLAMESFVVTVVLPHGRATGAGRCALQQCDAGRAGF
jgi:hypothetical protein